MLLWLLLLLLLSGMYPQLIKLLGDNLGIRRHCRPMAMDGLVLGVAVSILPTYMMSSGGHVMERAA